MLRIDIEVCTCWQAKSKSLPFYNVFYLRGQELLPVGFQVVEDTSPSPGQSCSPHEQDEEDDVWERGSHPHHLPGGTGTQRLPWVEI